MFNKQTYKEQESASVWFNVGILIIIIIEIFYIFKLHLSKHTINYYCIYITV